MTRPDRQEHLHSACGRCSLAAGNRWFCPGGIVKLAGELKVVKPFEYPGRLTLIWGDWWEDVVPDTPCEVRFDLDVDVDAKVTVERPRWRVIRRYGRSYAINPDRIHVFASTDHTSAIAYADRLARQETR